MVGATVSSSAAAAAAADDERRGGGGEAAELQGRLLLSIVLLKSSFCCNKVSPAVLLVTSHRGESPPILSFLILGKPPHGSSSSHFRGCQIEHLSNGSGCRCDMERFERINPNKPNAANWKVGSMCERQCASFILIIFLRSLFFCSQNFGL